MPDKETSLTDAAWQRLLTAKGIDLATAKFPVELAMGDLEKVGGRQARLMNSMDERDKWPPCLQRHNVFPLSTSKTRLVLVKADPFYDFPAISSSTATYEARLPIRFVTHMLGRGENAHIMRLHTAGFLQKFLGGAELYSITSGRRHSPEFTVFVNRQAVSVKSVQYEMDGQYESDQDVVPIEMKASPYQTCAIKQVYMPFRSLGEDTKWDKPVRPLYITFSEARDEYVVRELGFARREVWESIRVVNGESIRLNIKSPPAKLLNVSVQLLDSTRVPQADRPHRIQDLPGAVLRGINNANLLAEKFEFDVRQSSYYRDAAEMLGLIATERGTYILTRDGRRFAERPPQKQADELASRMCRLPAVNTVLVEMERRGTSGIAMGELDAIVATHAGEHGEPTSGSTVHRRAQTIKAWLKFIGSRTGAIVATKDRLYLRKEVPRLDEFDPSSEAQDR